MRYCVKGWQISTATGATVSFSLGGSLENPAVPVVRKMKKGAFTSEENPKLYKYLERGKGTVCHQWCKPAIPCDLYPDYMVRADGIYHHSVCRCTATFHDWGCVLKYFGIPVALTWFMSQKTFDGKSHTVTSRRWCCMLCVPKWLMPEKPWTCISRNLRKLSRQ